MEAVDIFIHNFLEGLLDSQQCVPSLAEGDLGRRVGRGREMLNFVLMLTSAFHQNHFFLGGEVSYSAGPAQLENP